MVRACRVFAWLSAHATALRRGMSLQCFVERLTPVADWEAVTTASFVSVDTAGD